MRETEKRRQDAMRWAAKTWPLPGESVEQNVYHEIARQVFMAGYDHREREERRMAYDKQNNR